MNHFNKIMLGSIAAILLTAMTIEPPKIPKIKVYLKKENAQKYCDMYKDSHNYSVEEKELTE